MKRIFSLFVCLSISLSSFGQDKTASTSATLEIPPGPTMKETENWIKRELPKMGRDSVVEAVTAEGKTFNVETNYEIAKATLADCTMTVQSVSQWVIASDSQSRTVTVTMKDLDLSQLVAVEATPYGDSRVSKPSYVVRLVAQSNPNMPLPFTVLTTGYAGGPTTRSVAAVNVRVRDIGSADQVAIVFRRAAVLCGAPDRPVDPTVLVSCEAAGEQVSCGTSKVAARTESVTAKPTGNSAMTNDIVIQLATAKLSDQVIITSIREAPTKEFDLTPTGLIALKKAGVSDAVIVVMQEKSTTVQAPSESEAKTLPKYDATLTQTAKPPTDNGCSGIELMGLYKDDWRPVMPLILWFAKVRNGTSLTRIVIVSWTNLYGEDKSFQAQVKPGDIATLELTRQQPVERQPINLRLSSCR